LVLQGVPKGKAKGDISEATARKASFLLIVDEKEDKATIYICRELFEPRIAFTKTLDCEKSMYGCN
jgi:hypothetical protein